MTVWEIPTLFAIAVLGGIKGTYGIKVWKEEESSVFLVWSNKETYVLSGICLLFYSVIWIFFGKVILAVRITDFLYTYGILALVDGKRKVIPDEILICYFAGQMLLGALCMIPEELFGVFLKGLVFATVLFIFAWFSKEKIGWGDVKLLSVTAVTAGWDYTFQMLMAALFLSFLYSICLLAFQKKSIQTKFPFVPFLTTGAVVQMMLSVYL